MEKKKPIYWVCPKCGHATFNREYGERISGTEWLSYRGENKTDDVVEHEETNSDWYEHESVFYCNKCNAEYKESENALITEEDFERAEKVRLLEGVE